MVAFLDSFSTFGLFVLADGSARRRDVSKTANDYLNLQFGFMLSYIKTAIGLSKNSREMVAMF